MAELFIKIAAATRSKVSRAISEIEQTRTRTKAAEMRLLAAKNKKIKMKEAMALAEIKTLSRREHAWYS